MNVPEPDEALFEQAKAEAWKRVQADIGRSTPEVKPLLLHIADCVLAPCQGSLFGSGFGALQVKEACSPSKEVLSRFRSELGLGLGRYISRCKIEAAKELLRYRDLKVWRIAAFTGYGGLPPFWRAFNRWTGHSPSEFRKRASPRQRRMVCATELNSDAFWWKATVGHLEPEQRQGLRERLQTRVLSSLEAGRAKPVPVVTFAIRGTEHEKVLPKRLWERLRKLPREEQRHWLRHVRVDSPAFFHFLGKKSLDESHRDPHKALELSETALGHIESNAAFFGVALPGLRALGLAWRANALRRMGDFPEATRNFKRSWEQWEAGGKDPCVEAEICNLEAVLRRIQRRFEEALELLSRSISLAQTKGCSHLLAVALLQRASVIGYTGGPKTTIPDIQLALRQLKGLDEPHLTLTAYNHLATSHALAGEHHKALAVLPKARTLCEALDEPVVWHQLQWVEGLARQGLEDVGEAERLLQEARAGLSGLEAVENAALVSVDLAILYLHQGRSIEVLPLAAEAISAFECLHIPNEKWATVKLLREALEANEVTLDALQETRDLLDAIWREPARGVPAADSQEPGRVGTRPGETKEPGTKPAG